MPSLGLALLLVAFFVAGAASVLVVELAIIRFHVRRDRRTLGRRP